MADAIGSTYTLNISQMKKAIEEANRLIKNNESVWLSSASAMGDWSKSEEGLKKRLDSLSKTIGIQEDTLKDLTKAKEEAIKKYGETSNEVNYLNTQIIKVSKSLKSNKSEVDKVQKSLDEFSEETNEAGDESKKTAKQVDKLENSAKGLDGGFSIAKGAIAGFIANGLTALVGACKNAISSLVGLAESTREYRTQLATLSTVADSVGASGDYVIDKWMDVNSVINDEQAVVEGINNLLSAGYTAEKEMDAITKALEGASLKWKDTLKFEGLADSLQEWIGSGGESLTGNFAELLERLGYNLEEVTEQTKGMTDAQRRNWAIQTLNKEGLADVSEAYREANKDLIDYNKAQADLLNAQSLVGEMMEPFITTVKQGTADVIYSFVDMANGVEGAGDQLLYNIGYLAGSIYKNIQGAIQTILPVVKSFIPEIINFITTNLPELLSQGVAIATNIIDGISQNIPNATSEISTMLSGIISTISSNVTPLFNSALELFGQIVLAIPQIIVDLTAELPRIISSITDGLTNGENSVFDTAINVLSQIVSAIPVFIGDLAKNLPKIIDTISESLSNAIPTIFEGAKTLLNQIVEALPETISNLVASLPDIITSIIGFLGENGGSILTGAFDLLMNIVKAIPKMIIELVKELPSIITSIITGLKDGVVGIFQAGKDLIAGLVDGIFSFDIVGKMKEFGGKLLGGIKSFFGIKSPSRIMRDEVGKYLAEGLAVGIQDGEYYVADSIEELAKAGIEAVENFDELGTNSADTFIEGWKDGLEGKKRDFTESTEKVVEEVAKDVKETAKKTGSEIGKTITNATATTDDNVEKNDVLKDIQSVVDGIIDVGKEGGIEVEKTILSTIGNAFGAWGNIASSIYDFFVGYLANPENGGIEEASKNFINNLLNGVYNLLDNLPLITETAIKFIKNFAVGLIKSIPELIKKIPKILGEMCKAFITQGIPMLFEVGKSLIQGLWEGIKSIGSWLWDGIKTVGGWIVDGFKWIFGINSPSKVMADEVGKNLALGIEEGLTDNLKHVNSAIKNGVNTSVELDQNVAGRKMVTVNQTNNYSQAHSRYELYKSKRDVANAVKLAMQGA